LVPLSETALHVIKSESEFGDYVFPARGFDDRRVSGFSKWKRSIDESSAVKNWRLHDLRRTVASKLAELGTPLHIIKRILNHSDAIPGVAGTYNRYSYLGQSREALIAWEKSLNLILSNPLLQDEHALTMA
jgi:integrase